MAYHYVLTWSLLASVIATIVAFGLIGIGVFVPGKKLALKKVGLKSATKNVGETPAKLWSDVFSE